MKQKTVIVRVSDKEKREIERRARERGVTISDIVRRALRIGK